MAERRPTRVLIVDDEPLARQRLEDLLRAENGVEIVASVDNGEAAVDAVRSLHPDIAFLDVQMPGKTGIDVVREVGPEAMPLTIFVTAYDRYALQAFDLAAVDYLVKPFDDERFEQAFQRARRYVELEEMGELRERLADRAYDLIVSDVRMPDGDGQELYRGVGERAPALARRFIFITGDTVSPETRSFLQEVSNPCLAKPFRVREVRETIARLLE